MSLLLPLLVGLLLVTGVKSIGICYGRDGSNLQFSETDVVNLCKRNGIGGIRVYAVNPQILDALRGSNLDVVVDIPNQRLQELNDPARANDWVRTNIAPYSNVRFKYVVVGNEIYAGDQNSAQYVPFLLPALRNVQNALLTNGFQGIKATTQTYSTVVMNPYPPSSGEFKDDAKALMVPLVQFLAENGSPLLASIYPYFGRVYNPKDISLSFALFTDTAKNGAGYSNLFDALYDSMYAAVFKAMPGIAVQSHRQNHREPKIVIGESGWPSGGGPGHPASSEYAATYYTNLIAHVSSDVGTPMSLGPIETYLFSMFDENKKPGDEDERHFGLFNPDLSPKYGLRFN